MSRQNGNEEIRKQIKGSEKLFEIYTYFPTLHDAKIRNIDINFEKKEILLTVNYCDFIKVPGDEVLTKFTICWRNVSKADFNWYAEDLYGIEFSFEKDFIKTTFVDYSSGFDGEIISGEIEITNVEIQEKSEALDKVNIVKFSIG